MNNTINPTRLERTNQINRMRTARRGHKLLKDKSDEMFRNLNALITETEILRKTVAENVSKVFKNFFVARAKMAPVEIENAINAVRENYTVNPTTRNIMGLIVPRLEIIEPENVHDWHFVTTHNAFDQSVHGIVAILPKIVELSALERTCQMLGAEIKLLRRRVNALEYSVIPKIKQNIGTITMKLSENERGNLVRLMKIKDLHKN